MGMSDYYGNPQINWSMSPTIGKLADSLAKAQGKFETVKKDTKNGAYAGSKYAELASIIDATKKHLSDEGIAVIQMPRSEFGESEAKMLHLTTMLAHNSGEWISCDLSMPAIMRDRFDAQSVGSAVTYARRYSLQSMLGIAAEADDDGNAAVGKGTVEAAQSVAIEKLRAHVRTNGGSELVTITPYKDGFLALSGNSLPVIRSEMKGDMKAKLGWVQRGNVDMFVKEHKAHFIDFCTSIKVSVIDESSGTAAMNESRSTPVETPFSQDPDTDPLILDTKRVERTGKKPFLAVKWNGMDINCFDKNLWPFIEGHVKRPAHFDWSSTPDGKYKNLLHIVRLSGMPFELQEAPYKAEDGDVGF